MDNKEPKIIQIRGSINSDKGGYNYLSSLYHTIINSLEKSIVLDFRDLRWLDANLAAVLGAIMKLSHLNGFSIQLQNIPNETSNVFLRNGFLNASNTYSQSSSTETVVNYWEFLPSQNDFFYSYIQNEILAKDCFPICSPNLQKEITRNIFELYNNACMHGGTSHICTCGQHYPRKIPAKLDFTIVNLGRTFVENVNSYMSKMGGAVMSAHQAIDWASKEKNSTKIDRSGGLGLSLLISFIQLNKGKIQIVSDNGFWEYNNGVNVVNTSMESCFPGVIVTIEFDVSNTNDIIYLLKDEAPVSTTNLF